MTANIAYEDTWLPLVRAKYPLESRVTVGSVAAEAVAMFDYDTDGHTVFTPWRRPDLPETWGIGVIVGGSGTGKSTLLTEFGTPAAPSWGSGAVADHFADADEARARLYAVGLSSVPAWVKPYSALSTGERFRADLARTLAPGAVVDEFTSVVDRNVAQAASRSIRRYVDTGIVRNIVLATCHRDVLPDLRPDWIIDTDGGVYALNPRECLQREPLVAHVYQVHRSMWLHYVGHHYLTGNLHPFARCYIAAVRGTPVSFAAAIPFPHGHIRNAWRGHRVVTLPDYQGLGVGPRLADWVAEAHHRAGYGYYTKTTHPRLGQYRDASPLWTRVGSQTPRPAVSFKTRRDGAWIGSERLSYSHRYIGERLTP